MYRERQRRSRWLSTGARLSGTSGNDPDSLFWVAVLVWGMQRSHRPELPTLDPGVQLLDVQAAGRAAATEPLAALAVDHLLTAGGRACWVDAGGHARTGPLTRLAPGPRLLERVRVARGFTAHQHAELVRRLATEVDDDTALLVVPALDLRYREDEAANGRALLLRSLARLARVAREHAVPVLMTRTRADDFAAPVATAAERTIACERTQFGPRFRAEGFETLVYPQGDGTVQTTLAFWQSVLAARHEGIELGGDVAEGSAESSAAEGHALAPSLAPAGPRLPTEVVVDGSH